MKFSHSIVALLPAAVLSVPFTPNLIPRTLTYDAANPPVIFTDATCTLSHYLTQGQPLSFAYPTALSLGGIVTPLLDLALGKPVVEDIDLIADQLCVNAQQDPLGGNGICQDALQAISDFSTAIIPATQAAKYRCLLNLLCVAHTGVPYQGTCNFLLAGSDCIANRIVGVSNLECY